MKNKMKSMLFYGSILFYVEYVIQHQIMLEGISSVKMIATYVFGVMMFIGFIFIAYHEFVSKNRTRPLL